eukprot:8991351-Pyramimonas_sp.AAC.1
MSEKVSERASERVKKKGLWGVESTLAVIGTGGPPVHMYHEQWEKVGNWTQGEKRERVSGVLSAPFPLLAQEDPQHEVTLFRPRNAVVKGSARTLSLY